MKKKLMMNVCLAAVLLLASPISLAGGAPNPEYAYIYNQTVQRVKHGEAVNFDAHSELSQGIIHETGSSDIVFKNQGSYLVTFYAIGITKTFGLFLDGKPVEGGVYGYYTSGQIGVTGQVLIKAETGSVLTFRPYSPDKDYATGALLTISLGEQTVGKQQSLVNASLVILKVD